MSLVARPIPTGRLITTTAAFPKCLVGRLPRTTFRGLNGVHMTLRPVYSPHRQAACCLEGFDGFVTSTAAPIATGWSDLCRVGIAPTEVPTPLHDAQTPTFETMISGCLEGVLCYMAETVLRRPFGSSRLMPDPESMPETPPDR